VNFPDALSCARCEIEFTFASDEAHRVPKESTVARRILICAAVCVAVLLGFYVSLIVSSSSLTTEQKRTVHDAILVLKQKGFADDAFLLERLTVFRSDDNWLNASVAKENAFAATNFPFEIVTLYSDFFTYPKDDTERAAILLHEARHLRGEDEKEAYAFVWMHREQLGWTREKYPLSIVWQNIRKQTRDNVPELFVCVTAEYTDCTEPPTAKP